ncbi:MAG: PEP-CTERM sorting domain-containing protein [Pseudomonadota bacterium]|nr:PEP-CTERM sorting domain-containing protein [Pseudomonadota bacterium]
MRHYLVLALAALALVLTTPSAFAIRIRIVDPAPTPCSSNTPCSIYDLGTTYQADFVSCSHPPTGTIPRSVNTEGFSYCLWLNNVTGNNASRFDFDLTVPEGAGGQSLQCQSDNPENLMAIQCPEFLPAAGSPFGVTFLMNPPLGYNRDFYMLTDFLVNPGSAGVTLSATSVPEPGELGLFGLGLLAIGLGYGWQKGRRVFKGNEAA